MKESTNIWIIDKFEIDDNIQFFIDIKELNDYKNIFKLNEDAGYSGDTDHLLILVSKEVFRQHNTNSFHK